MDISTVLFEARGRVWVHSLPHSKLTQAVPKLLVWMAL
jgi:hypothetical protein